MEGMNRLWALSIAALTLSLCAGAQVVDIKYEKFRLSNGLTVIVHEDRKAPVVAVNVWYHVGSKNEKPGKTGFAHLFEHLMFNGSEHFNQDYFKALEKYGATDLNGTTNNDRTNYFQTVPTSALDSVLFLESDRMGHLLGAIDQAKLDEQRGVVQNEKRQFENQPYAVAEELIVKATYPAGHPYSWTVIGSMEDLTAASLNDVKEWFKSYYGPNNAVIALAGDIDAKTAREKVEKYFGDIPPGPPLPKFESWVAKRTGETRQLVEDRVPQSKIQMIWNIPGYRNTDSMYLDLASDVLGSGKTSRLYKRLVYTDQSATNVAAYMDLREIGSQFYLEADVRPGADAAKVEAAMREELAKFLSTGPGAEELKRVQTLLYANFVRGAERVGGFGGKSDILASNEVYARDAGFYRTMLQTKQAATPKFVQDASQRWLSDGAYILHVKPFDQELKAISKGVDRTKLPEPGASPDLKMPALQRMTLGNGLKLVVVERHDLPLVSVNLIANAGYSGDLSAIPGTARLTSDMLDEGTTARNALEISEQIEALGARISSGSGLETSNVSLSSLKSTLPQAMEIFADVVLNPAFPEKELARVKKQQIAAIQRERSEPFGAALRVLPKLVYGPGHAYSMPFSGSGTEADVERITAADLKKFHQDWFRPNNSTLILVGDTTLAEAKSLAEKLFSNWKQGQLPRKNIAAVPSKEKSAVYLIDKPGAIQSVIITGQVAPPRNNPDVVTIDTMNTILGGAFVSRLNMNLREDKHWSYGAQSIYIQNIGPSLFVSFAPVQSDKTKESIGEILGEMRGMAGARPASAEELGFAKDTQTLSLPGSQETIRGLMGSVSEIVQFGLPDDYYSTLASRVRAVSRDNVTSVAEKVLKPERLVWVVVGDRAKIEPGIRELNLGPITIIDADGNAKN
jgi:zinc protease